MAHANQVKLNSLLSTEQCKAKGFMEGVGFITAKGKAYNLAITFRNLLGSFDYLTGDLTTIEAQLDAMVDDDIFISKPEKEAEVTLTAKQLKRYLEHERKLGRTPFAKNITGNVPVDAYEVFVTADAVFDNGSEIEVVKYKRGEPSLSYRGQRFDTKPQNSIELYLMQRLGETIFKKSKKPVKASYYFMKNKGDNKLDLVEEFEAKKGQNIVSWHFDTSPIANIDDKKIVDDIEERILNLINTKLSFSERTCDESQCETCQFSRICNYEEPIQQELEKVEEVVKSASGSSTIQLTDDQKKLVNFDIGFCRVNAGAGSGKSTTIVFRCIELIKKGVKPEDILLITFTNKGCQELKEKIGYWVKALGINVDVSSIKIFTFNGVGEKVLKEDYDKLGFEERPRLAEKVERYDIIFKLLDMVDRIEGLDYKNPLLDMPYAKGCVVEVNNLFNKLKAKEYKTTEDFAEDIKKPVEYATRIWELYQYFCEELVENSLILYDDQINYALQVFRAFPEVLRKYTVRHIMIDEFQDTHDVQMEFIKILVKQGKFDSLVVVGDDSQAIFGFREVTPENIINFNKMFKSSRDINLVDNFRSTPEIITTANLLNSKNKNRVKKDLISRRPSGKRPSVVQAQTQDAEYTWIADEIQSKIAGGVVPQEIAVIARTKSELLEIEGYLKKRNIPVVIEATELVLNNKNIQMVLSFANFFGNNERDLDLLAYLVMFNKDAILQMSSAEMKSLLTQYRLIFKAEYEALTTEEERLDFFFKQIAPIASKDKIVEDFMGQLQDKNFKKVRDLVDYLQKFALYEDEKAVNKEEVKYKAVVLTTAHSSKGKEFDVVYNTINKYKYHGARVGEKEQEEERRLLFVSITRAKNELYVTYNSNADGKKKVYYGFASDLEAVHRISVA